MDDDNSERKFPEAKKAKPLSSAQSAKQRAEEIRRHGGDLEDGTDDFWVDLSTIPDGWEYEWKKHTVYGMEDASYTVALRRAGWTNVPSSRHPEMMPIGHSDDFILRKGMILMERPKEISDEIRAKDRKAARDQIRMKEQQLNEAPAGQFERANKDAPLAKVKKGFEPIPIPED